MAENNNKNSFQSTVEALFKGMDNFITTKTVVGDAIHINDNIILPLIDVSFGVGAGAFRTHCWKSVKQRRHSTDYGREIAIVPKRCASGVR